MINLREVVLMNRVRYSNVADHSSLEKALGCLERYLYMITFCAYIKENSGSSFFSTFSSWLSDRPGAWSSFGLGLSSARANLPDPEILRMLEKIRKKGPRLSIFRPVDDLSVLSEGVGRITALGRGPSKPVVTELDKHVIKSRLGSVLGPQTILKVDHWASDLLVRSQIEGAPNFRYVLRRDIQISFLTMLPILK